MTHTGLEIICNDFPSLLKGKRIGILCHAPSITSDYTHVTDILFKRDDCRLSAIFGPQHGIFGQTQDNMIEWEGYSHPLYKVPVFSLYGYHRKPSPEMLEMIDILLIDLQDIGARIYTYAWTVKLCIEACSGAGIPVCVLDRPNPVGKLPYDGPVLKKEFFTFVGGATVPLCHRMTLGELSLMIRDCYYPACELHVIWMKGWSRNSMYDETGLPWVLPSPNIPTLHSAVVYPGSVLVEGLNLSEGRGTTIPFELLGAPFIDANRLKANLDARRIPGAAFRIHNFIPTFNKFAGMACNGIQLHVTDTSRYRPVSVALDILDAIIETSPPSTLEFNEPPYEYENTLLPFDILAGDTGMRKTLQARAPLERERERWRDEIEEFRKEFRCFFIYPDN
jgi:uncharacterized protein YbbC (DUF1343 family)